ncbi:hypothetical protein ACJRO7_009890 [Eucalyptus globulus]|uniref:Retrotransposon gag domain-containing protein n=1 Tax=Eucalyptus globulus TaxID=34317 RepID=A0ABD3LF33_EUCGL
MADQTEMHDRMTAMENQLQQLLTSMQLMTNQMQSLQVNQTLAPTLPEIVVPKQTDKAHMGDDDMPELEDDPLFVTAEKAKPNNVPKAEQDERFAKLEEKLKQLQESRNSLPFDLSVYEKVKVPKKFKMPEFEKYDGTSCPKAHLQMYHVRMAQYVKNEPLMIQSFHASLTGPALNWYIMKNVNLLDTWNDVADAFLKQYKFNMDIAPSREDLERMEKKKSESFKEYAVRWRNLAAQITPEPTNKELMKLFVKTLPYEFRNWMASTYVENFNQLIPVGEQIEMGLRDGWFNEPTHQGKRFTMKKDKEPITEVNVAYAQPAPSKPPMVRILGNQQDGGRVPAQRQFTKRQFSPLPGPLSQVLPILQKKGLISHEPKRPNAEKFSNYDPSKKCDYHMGEVGHSTDECLTLKHKIQNLLDTKAFSFRTTQPNVKKNPLPEHQGNVNAIFEFNAGKKMNSRCLSKISIAD